MSSLERRWLWNFAVALAAGSALLSAMAAGPRMKYLLVDALVWGADDLLDPAPYAADVRAVIEQHRKRFAAYKSKRMMPKNDSLMEMVFFAQETYERRLVAVSTSLNVDALAMAFVTDMKICYEWEGGSDCPEREALFASAYQSAHPAGPFSHYLPLLEAHRWLCAAEGFDYENKPADSARARNSYGKALATAQRSTSIMVRTAAAELAIRGQCHPEEK